MRSCDRPSKSSASVFFLSSVSKVYSFSTGTQGSSCRSFASSSSRLPSSCSRSCSCLTAADHSSRVPTLCFGIAFASFAVSESVDRRLGRNSSVAKSWGSGLFGGGERFGQFDRGGLVDVCFEPQGDAGLFPDERISGEAGFERTRRPSAVDEGEEMLGAAEPDAGMSADFDVLDDGPGRGCLFERTIGLLPKELRHEEPRLSQLAVHERHLPSGRIGGVRERM